MEKLSALFSFCSLFLIGFAFGVNEKQWKIKHRFCADLPGDTTHKVHLLLGNFMIPFQH